MCRSLLGPLALGHTPPPSPTSPPHPRRPACTQANSKRRQQSAGNVISFGVIEAPNQPTHPATRGAHPATLCAQVHDFETEERNNGSAPPTPNGEGDSPIFTSMASPAASVAAERPAQPGTQASPAAVIDAQAVASGPPAEVIRLLEASNEKLTMWHWSDSAKLLAMTDHSQVLRVLNVDGKLVYRVQLPPEGTTILL
jgi:hypothetical protein